MTPIIPPSPTGFRRTGALSPSFQRWVRALLVAFCLAPLAAEATFHLWFVTELYSNADGSVQFIKLFTASSSQNLLAGHVITCSGPQGTHSFTFPSNLPSATTANQTFLIGTSNLATIPGGVTPDYMLTNSVPFLFLTSGVTNLVGIVGSVELPAAYTNLPTDGESSLTGSSNNLVITANAPKNFSSQSNHVVPLQFLPAQLIDTNFVMSFRTATGVNGSAGTNYNVQYRNDLSDTNWTTLATVPGNGATQSVSNATASAAQRFFRLKVP